MQKRKTALTNKSYYIVSKRNGKALSVENESQEIGAYLNVQELNSGKAQQWKFVKSQDCYKLVNQASGKAADIIVGGTENGSWLHQWDKAETARSAETPNEQ